MDEQQINSERILRLPVPHGKNYFCSIVDHNIFLSRLVIGLDKRGWNPEKRLYLVFRHVLYFEGPMKWQSADFQIASEAEFELVLSRLFYVRPSLSDFRESHKLFVVQTSLGPVKILAYPVVLRLKSAPGLPKPESHD